MDCRLCTWLCDWLCKDSPVRGDTVWEKSHNWDRSASNDYELWQEEPDRERITEADLLFKSNPGAAICAYKALASLGSVWSMQILAHCHEYGQGVGRDLALAENWYDQAINSGSWMATLGLARTLQKQGHFAECIEVLEGGVSGDFTPAFFWLPWYRLKQSNRRKTFAEILPLLEHAADEGHPAAQFHLSRWMILGKFGFRRIPEGFRRVNEFMNLMRAADGPAVPITT